METETVERALGLAAQVKWPNDVMVNRRKVAGILAEASNGTVVLGIGVNVNQTREQLPQDASTAPGSLYTSDGVRRERAPLLADFLLSLERTYDPWRERGLTALYDTLVNGRAGFGIGIDRNGRLEVAIDGERLAVESGEVRFER